MQSRIAILEVTTQMNETKVDKRLRLSLKL